MISLRPTLNALLLTAALCFSTHACAQDRGSADSPPNFIIMIGDDMGVETIPCYPVGSQTATTPTLDSLCASGMRFDNFWSQPVCSPTRASILSGQYGFRNGVGTPTSAPEIDYVVPAAPDAGNDRRGNRRANRRANGGGGGGGGGGRRNQQYTGTPADPNRPGLRPDTYALPAALKADESLGYQAAAVGKWHLATLANGGMEHPQLVGFDHYAGGFRAGGVESYFAWSKVVDAQMTDGKTGYVTSDTVDDALHFLEQRDQSRPYLLWVAFNAPHTPNEVPPANLLSDATNEALKDVTDPASSLTVYHAMIEAMDTEIGRLLDGLPAEERDNTYVIFLGDNGTPTGMATAPFDREHSKGTVYQGGVNVPLIVSGPGIEAGSTTAALANSVDLFATVLDLAGTADDPRLAEEKRDAVSLRPVFEDASASVRDYAFVDVFGPSRNGERNARAIRNDQYKLYINEAAGRREFYDLLSDPAERNNLLAGELDGTAQANLDELDAELTRLLDSL